MKTKKILIFIITILVINSCDILQQVSEIATFSKCEFKLKSIQNISLAGVNMQNIKSFSDIKILDAAKITAAFTGGRLPLEFTLNVDVKNPNSSQASMNKLEWIILIDNIEITRGVSNNRIQIAPNGGVSTFPLHIATDLKKVLSGKSGDTIFNFALNLAGVGNKPTRVTLKAKPTIMVGNIPISYPGYITVNTDFSS